MFISWICEKMWNILMSFEGEVRHSGTFSLSAKIKCDDWRAICTVNMKLQEEDS